MNTRVQKILAIVIVLLAAPLAISLARAAAGNARRALGGDVNKLQRFEDLIKPLGLDG